MLSLDAEEGYKDNHPTALDISKGLSDVKFNLEGLQNYSELKYKNLTLKIY